MSADHLSVLGGQVVFGGLQELLRLLKGLREACDLCLEGSSLVRLVAPVQLNELGYLVQGGHAAGPEALQLLYDLPQLALFEQVVDHAVMGLLAIEAREYLEGVGDLALLSCPPLLLGGPSQVEDASLEHEGLAALSLLHALVEELDGGVKELPLLCVVVGLVLEVEVLQQVVRLRLVVVREVRSLGLVVQQRVQVRVRPGVAVPEQPLLRLLRQHPELVGVRQGLLAPPLLVVAEPLRVASGALLVQHQDASKGLRLGGLR